MSKAKYLNPADVKALLGSATPADVFEAVFTKKNGEDRSITFGIAPAGSGLKYNPADYGLVVVTDLSINQPRMVNTTTIKNLRKIA